jgi:hypothetical protein
MSLKALCDAFPFIDVGVVTHIFNECRNQPEQAAEYLLTMARPLVDTSTTAGTSLIALSIYVVQLTIINDVGRIATMNR